MALLHLGCPACGGALCLAEGERITACRYCGGRCLVLVPDAVPRYAVEASVGRDAAVRIALESLQRPPQ
jgi:DNA-directed RNA polymerase subunit RPC12/RpoP